jgi:hypothetical protein
MALDLTWAVNAKRAVARSVFLASTCDIVRTTETTDAGGSTETRTTIATDEPCFYTEDLTDQEIATAERLNYQVRARMYFPGERDIRVNDEITNLVIDGAMMGYIDDTATFVPYRYEVSSAPRATYEVTRLAYVSGPA